MILSDCNHTDMMPPFRRSTTGSNYPQNRAGVGKEARSYCHDASTMSRCDRINRSGGYIGTTFGVGRLFCFWPGQRSGQICICSPSSDPVRLIFSRSLARRPLSLSLVPRTSLSSFFSSTVRIIHPPTTATDRRWPRPDLLGRQENDAQSHRRP